MVQEAGQGTRDGAAARGRRAFASAPKPEQDEEDPRLAAGSLRKAG